MPEIPQEIIRLIEKYQFDLSKKADQFLSSSLYSFSDLVNVVLNGYVYKKEKDAQKASKYKYVIYGLACNGNPMYLVGKICFDRFFIITFHERR